MKTLRIIFKVIFFTAIAMIAGIILFVQFLKSDLNTATPIDVIEQWANEAKQAEALPLQFYEIYDQINAGSLSSSTTSHIVRQFSESRSKPCPCFHLAALLPFRITPSTAGSRNRLLNNRFVLSWKLERRLDQKECLNLLVEKYDFTFGQVGLQMAAQFYFGKSIDSLNKKEIATLVLMLENPIFYNPKRRPQLIEDKLKELEIIF